MDNPIISHDGSKCWNDSNGKAHRDGGPARQYIEGIDVWYQHGLRHREDGPAIEYPNEVRDCWCLDGIVCTFEEWLSMGKLSDEEKVMFKLKYG